MTIVWVLSLVAELAGIEAYRSVEDADIELIGVDCILTLDE